MEREVLVPSLYDPVTGQFKAASGESQTSVKKHFFTEEVVKSWNWLSREVVNTPSLSVLNRHLDNAHSNMI